jgi:hypothetical protein
MRPVSMKESRVRLWPMVLDYLDLRRKEYHRARSFVPTPFVRSFSQ